MEFTAKLNYIRVSPQKARLVLDLIKGRRVEEALDTLRYTKKGVAPAIYKLLRSAVENANYVSAEKSLDIDLDRLYVKSAIANDGPRMKRIRPAPMGRAFRYQRRISHLNIVLAEKPGDQRKAETSGATAAGTAKKSAKKAVAKKAAAKKAPAKKFAGKKTAGKK
jgi:large subunit ribosomal protein L22